MAVVAVAVGLIVIAFIVVGLMSAPEKPQVAPKATASPTPAQRSPSPSVTPSSTLAEQKEQVRQAFYRYEDAFALAGKIMDPSPLLAVAQGQILDYSQSAVEHARSINQPYLVQADLTITSIVVAQGLGGPNLGAQVDDTYVDHTVRLDPKTLQPIEPDPHRPGKESITFQEVSPGLWKAVFATGIN